MKRQVVDVYASWVPIESPLLIGQLTFAETSRGGVFSFTYDPDFLKSKYRLQIDPLLYLHRGEIYNDVPDKNFRVFLDSSPDRWGRILMQRRAGIEYRKGLRSTAKLTELDYLLGVHDSYRMGGIRFAEPDSRHFLDDNDDFSAPPMASLRDLEHAAIQIEKDADVDSEEYLRWLNLLIAPGSSLGGARPKACVVDPDGQLWIAKFPNQSDTVDVGAWEMVCHRLALDAGIEMAPCQLRKFSSNYHTFLTKRFDRENGSRIHFSSAMTQLNYYDGEESEGASYLEIAEFLTNHGSQTSKDLAQLWRRIVFNIAVSNTDDHLRNHGLLLDPKGWRLSPAYDLNPVVGKSGLHLNITDAENALNYDLAFDVAEFFRLTPEQATVIYDDVLKAVSRWQGVASQLSISRSEQLLKQEAFNV